MAIWQQHYNPLGNMALSTIVAALPVVVLLGSIALLRARIHLAALAGVAIALLIALAVYRMPPSAAIAATLFGAAYGLFPIGWIILNLIFLYQLTLKKGLFAVLRGSLGTLAPDPRVQVILIAFCFGAFFEGVAGFGTPVAISSAILMELGFEPLAASGLSLIGNSAPVAFGALGTPIIALSGVTGIDPLTLSAMVGRQLPWFSMLIPFWIVGAMSGWRGILAVWPAALTAGLSFAAPQYLISNFHGPWLVDIVSSLASIIAMLVLLRFWRPKTIAEGGARNTAAPASFSRAELAKAWTPWVLLSVFVFVWGIPKVRDVLNGGPASPAQRGEAGAQTSVTKIEWPVAWLNNRVARGSEVALPGAPPEKGGLQTGMAFGDGERNFGGGHLRRFCDGLSSAGNGGDLLANGRLRALFVSHHRGDARAGLRDALRRRRRNVGVGAGAHRFPVSVLWDAARMAGRGAHRIGHRVERSVWKPSNDHGQTNRREPGPDGGGEQFGRRDGKMLDAQSLVVASTATNWYGHEGKILRYVFFHSLALAALMGILVSCQARV